MAHDVKRTGVSLLFKKNFAVQQVFRSGMWKSQSTFNSFYLRDVTHRSMDTFISLVVTAQQAM